MACRNREANARISTNENAAMAQLHSLFSAQTTYNAGKNHYACTIAELAAAPGLLDKEMSSGEKNGYAFSIHCLPQVDLPTYDIWATPLRPGETGSNLYCTDQTGMVRRANHLLDSCRFAHPVE
jgi:hypothetical protein